MYASTHPYTIDENGKHKYVNCHWDIVDDNKKFIPAATIAPASLQKMPEVA